MKIKVWILFTLMPQIYSSIHTVYPQEILRQLNVIYWLHNKPKYLLQLTIKTDSTYKCLRTKVLHYTIQTWFISVAAKFLNNDGLLGYRKLLTMMLNNLQ